MDDSNWLETIACVPVVQIHSLSNVEVSCKLGMQGRDHAHCSGGVRIDKILLLLQEEESYGQAEEAQQQ